MSHRLKAALLVLVLSVCVVGGGHAAWSGDAPEPAAHACLDLSEGSFAPLATPTRVLGAGLTYAGHLRETGQTRQPGGAPPIFDKAFTANTPTVAPPSAEAHQRALEAMEPGLGQAVAERDITLAPLLDYEVELGVALLEDEVPGEPPALGFFVANDLSERALAILGEGRGNRYAYWGASKSFEGFLPTSAQMWRPHEPVRDGLPCVRLTTRVNGAVRQNQVTSNMVYTLTELLDAARAHTGAPLRAGTWILTGTPSGVALAAPAWKVKLANLVGLDRFTRLSVVNASPERFLQVGDEVAVEAEGLGVATVTLVPPR